MASLLLAPLTTIAGNGDADTTDNFTKKGWSFNPCPVFAYESDLGLQLGAMCDIYNYGDGSDFPDYRHKIFVEAYYSTKNSGVFYAFYDTEHLIKGIRLTASASYIPEKMHSFYGFNGYASAYYPEFNANKDISTAYYHIDYKRAKAQIDLQGRIKGPFRWAAGASYYNYRIGQISQSPYDKSPYGSLYRDYVEAGLIREDEARGGNHLEFKAGAVYDTRDTEAAPDRGIWAEVLLYGSPDFWKGHYSYLKMSAHFRHYITLWRDRTVLAYHLAWQGTLAGEAPFYMQNSIMYLYTLDPTSEGLGSRNTLRGINYNRILGSSYAWANVEIRQKLFNFDLLGQRWYIAVNPFFDAGMTTSPYRLNEQITAAEAAPEGKFRYPDKSSTLYSGSRDALHMCAGIGGKIVMNYNFVLTGEVGFALDKRDGDYTIALGMNYIF